MWIHRDVPALSAADYERTLARFVEYVSDLPGVQAVYRFGSLSHPGISDLDVLVVVADDVSPWTLQGILAATRTDPITQFLFAHPPLVVPEAEVAEVRWVHTLDGLGPVWGVALDVPAPPEEVRRWLRVAEYVDFTFSVRSVLRSLEEVGLRNLLLLMTSCVHSLQAASEISGIVMHAPFAERVRALREGAAAHQPQSLQGVAEAAKHLVEALRKADRVVAEALVAQGATAPTPVREVVPWADGRFYAFAFPLRSSNGVVGGGLWWRYLGLDPRVEVYPSFYLGQFATYALGSGPFSRAHRVLFGTRWAALLTDPGYREVLRRRLTLVERIYEVVRRGGLVPMVPLGIGFRDPARIRPSRRRRLVRGLLARQLTAGRT
jgi:hypothetical protein